MAKKQTLIDASYSEIVNKWRAMRISRREELSLALSDYAVRFSYNSGHIENTAITYHDTREVFEAGKATSFSGDVRTLFEIQNLKACHEHMLDAFAAHKPINETLVLAFHHTLTQGTYDEARYQAGERPGEYKHRDYVVGINETGTRAADVSKEVRALCRELKSATPQNILTVAAYFHLVFESIHPFADGNGRCGRALMNYLFLLNEHPPLIVFDEDKMAYYSIFEAWDDEADLVPAVEFLKVETVKTWAKSLG